MSVEAEGLSLAPVPTTPRRGAVMLNNRIPRPNVVTRRAAAEPTGVVTPYRGVSPNNSNKNNHETLAKLFQASMLHEIRQLVMEGL